jgi:thioredoxin reductase
MHSCDVASPSEFAGKRVLIIGGRQSAFETGALLAEAGAQSVHIAPRHDLPRFEPSDWSWVGALLERIGKQPGWYRALDPNEKSELDARFWAEGRLKLEPWLGPRVQHPAIALHPGTNVENARSHDGGVKITLDDGSVFEVDTVVFATGYKPRLDRVRLLSEGNLLPAIETQDGVPLLDECLQTTVPGLYMTSLMATQAFGPFFAFTASAATAARIVGRSLQAASKT